MNGEARNGIDGPLKGVRVLDWTMYQFGPVASSMLGDMGADVVKIKALDGDVGRAVARMSSRPGLRSLPHRRLHAQCPWYCR